MIRQESVSNIALDAEEIERGAEKVRLFIRPYYNKETAEEIHAHGIRCNVFWSDEL